MVNVLLVDDQTLVRQAMASLLSLETDIVVVGQAANAEQALENLAELEVDVAVLDIEMGQVSGLELTHLIKAKYPKIKVLIVTTFGRPGYLNRAMAAGARGFLVKDAPSEKLVAAIRQLAEDGSYIDVNLAAEAMSIGNNPLSDREIEILRWAGTGATNAQIARQVCLAEGSVRNILSEAMAKLGGQTRVEAAKRAERLGWL